MPSGKLSVIAGPMFSGKTGKLVAITEVLTRMGRKVLTFKPHIDTRYGNNKEIQSHDNRRAKALLVDGLSPEKIREKIRKSQVDVVIFDEVQFFNRKDILSLIMSLRRKKLDIIAAGLLYDYRRQPFGATPDLLGLADERLELFAVCQKCGSLARHSERLKGNKSTIDVGATDKYIAVCEKCHRTYQ